MAMLESEFALPVSSRGLRKRARVIHEKVRDFVEDEIIPLEGELLKWHTDPKTKWTKHPKIQELTGRAQTQGLWNLAFSKQTDPHCRYGAGLSNVEYVFICEELGRSTYAPEIFNCGFPAVPDMEILIRYGSPEQKARWLVPMLRAEIRSCFAMTEPQNACSDANNISAEIRRDKDHYVINGRKWWTSGVYLESTKFCLLMGKSHPEAPRHQQHTILIVPLDTPGVKVIRPLTVFGYDDASHGGHADIEFHDVRVPLSHVLYREGRGFEVVQARLAAARLHHCLRMIGAAERALGLMVDRVQNRVAFGQPLAAQNSIQGDIAQSRTELEQCRLLALKAAHVMDHQGNREAMELISMLKLAAPTMAVNVYDRVIQAHGGMGVSQDTPVARLYSWARVMRIADGPDEVHRMVLYRYELNRRKGRRSQSRL